MTLPQYVVRSYGGNAGVAQLVNPIGASDLSFTISPTTGWVETVGAHIGSPLGTSGPFTVVIDRFTAQVEKILCTAINTSTGVVTVYNSGGTTGRGYDGTTAQAHTPGGSTAGVQTCFSAAEAEEANAAAVYGPGGGGSVVGLTGNPAGRLYLGAGVNVPSGTATLLANVTTDYLKGGFTAPGGSVLTVPVTGVYLVHAQTTVVFSAAANNVQLDIYRNAGIARRSITASGSGVNWTSSVSDAISLTAGDTLSFYLYQNSGSTQLAVSGADVSFLSASLISI